MADIGMFVDVPWTSQPQGAVEIDWSNPLSKGVVWLGGIIGGAPIQWNAGSYSQLVPTNSPSVVANIEGLGLKSNSDSSSYRAASEIGLDALGTGDFTIFARSIPASVSALTLIAGRYNGSGNWWIGHEASAQVQASVLGAGLTGGTATVGKPLNVVIKRVSGVIYLYVNGKFVASGAGTANWNTTSGLALANFGFIAGFPYSGSVEFVGISDRALSDAEVKSLSDNPWQIFKPKRQFISYSPKSPWSMRESKMRGITDTVTTSVQEGAFSRTKPLIPSENAYYIDYSNPLAIGLVSLISGRVVRDTIRSNDSNSINTVSVKSMGNYSCLYFNGINSRYSYGYRVFNTLNTGSVVLRFSMASFHVGVLLYQANAGFNAFAWHIPSSSNQPLILNLGSNTVRNTTKTDWEINKVYTIAVTWGTSIKLYVDGKLDNTILVAASPITNGQSSNTCLGAYDYGPVGNYFNGDIYYTSVYKRALSDAEIKNLSNNPWQIFKANKTPFFYNRTLYKDVQRYTPPAIENVPASVVVAKPRIIRTTQPQGPVEIDWSNPLTKGLKLCYNTAAERYADKQVNKLGATFKDNSAETPTGITFNQNSAFNNGLTFLSVGVVTGNNADQHNYGIRAGLINTTHAGVGLIAYRSGTELIANCTYYDYTGSGVDNIPHNTPIGGTLTMAMTYTRNSSEGLRAFSNGVLKATTATLDKNLSPISISLNLNNASGGTNNMGYLTYLNLYFDRALSDAEIKSLSENPWQIFKPNQQLIWGGK